MGHWNYIIFIFPAGPVEDVEGLLRPALEFNGWFLAVFAESSLRLYLEVWELRRARPAGATLPYCKHTAVAWHGWSVPWKLPSACETVLNGGRQLRPWVSRGSIIDCTAVAFNYDSNRSMRTAAGAKVTFLHSDYSHLLCASTVLRLHPSAAIVEGQVGLFGLTDTQKHYANIPISFCKYSYKLLLSMTSWE